MIIFGWNREQPHPSIYPYPWKKKEELPEQGSVERDLTHENMHIRQHVITHYARRHHSYFFEIFKREMYGGNCPKFPL